jgi:hypothetical protein
MIDEGEMRRDVVDRLFKQMMETINIADKDDDIRTLEAVQALMEVLIAIVAAATTNVPEAEAAMDAIANNLQAESGLPRCWH